MFLAIFHGEAIVFGMLLAGLVFWVSAFALLVLKWRYLADYKLQIVIGYLLLVAASCLPILSDSDFFGFIISSGLTLPWSFFVPAWLGVEGNPALAASLSLCGMINAALFYLLVSLFLKGRSRTAAG